MTHTAAAQSKANTQSIAAVRDACDTDAADVARIYNQSIEDGDATAPPLGGESRMPHRTAASGAVHKVTPDMLRTWLEEHRKLKCPMWVAEVDGCVAGWVSLMGLWGRPGFSHSAEIAIYIERTQRGRSLGRTMLKHVLERSRGLALDRLVALIWHDNAPSLGLFRSMGFQAWGCMPGVVWSHGRTRDMVILGRQIDPAPGAGATPIGDRHV